MTKFGPTTRSVVLSLRTGAALDDEKVSISKGDLWVEFDLTEYGHPYFGRGNHQNGKI